MEVCPEVRHQEGGGNAFSRHISHGENKLILVDIDVIIVITAHFLVRQVGRVYFIFFISRKGAWKEHHLHLRGKIKLLPYSGLAYFFLRYVIVLDRDHDQVRDGMDE